MTWHFPRGEQSRTLQCQSIGHGHLKNESNTMVMCCCSRVHEPQVRKEIQSEITRYLYSLEAGIPVKKKKCKPELIFYTLVLFAYVVSYNLLSL